MNRICSILFLCCMIPPLTACAPATGAGDAARDVSISVRPKPDPFTLGDSSAGSVSQAAPAFTAFGRQPAAWQAVIDGPLLTIERSSADLVTLTAERVHDKNSIELIKIRSTTKVKKGKNHKVNLIIRKAPCTVGQRAYELSATMFYNDRKYTGCAAAADLAAGTR